MNILDKQLLEKHGVIDDVFNYEDLDIDEQTFKTYNYFESKFRELYQGYAEVHNLKDCCFYIKSAYKCNAYAVRNKGYNIISITNVYPIVLTKHFNRINFESIALAGYGNEENLQNAYFELYEDSGFDISEFVLDCSIKYTFAHEFQHILQFNSLKMTNKSFVCQENLRNEKYEPQKHAREFDADRKGTYEVLKFAFRKHTSLDIRTDEKLKCLFFIGGASIIITKCLFYFGIINQLEDDPKIVKEAFYTKKFTHPHPLVRCLYIIRYLYDGIKDDFCNIDLEFQEFFNNILAIADLYFKSIAPKSDIILSLLNDMSEYINEVNDYSAELYDMAVQDPAIRNLLKMNGIKFEKKDRYGNLYEFD